MNERIGAPAVVGSNDARLDHARAFVRTVKALDRGERAALKRNAGNTIASGRGVRWFHRLLDDDGFKNDELYFLVASLMGLNDYSFSGNLGKSMALLANRRGSDSVAKRFHILLDADFDRPNGWKPEGGEVAFRLRQMVKLAASSQVGIDWAQLLADLQSWGHPRKWVQKRWAEAFYGLKPDDADGQAPATEGDLSTEVAQ